MTDHHLRTCRFCLGFSSDLLKYGRRHYAHPACFLDHGHKLSELKPWQIAHLPHGPLKQRGLLAEADQILTAYAERERAAGRSVWWEDEA